MAEDWETYRPSNGTEGDIFRANWCERCKRDQLYQQTGLGEHGCQILAATFMLDVTDPDYPKEWRRQISDTGWPGAAECTAFEDVSTPDKPERCEHTIDMFKECDA